MKKEIAKGKINLVKAGEDKKDERRLSYFLENISNQPWLPSMTECHILTGTVKKLLKPAPRADINIFSIA